MANIAGPEEPNRGNTMAGKKSDSPGLGSASPSHLGRNAIQDFAESISQKFSLTVFSGGEDPLQKFIKSIGGRIHYQDSADFMTSESGSIAVQGRNDFDVYLSAFTGPLRDRFTLAHELGHYFIHSNQGVTPIRASRRGSGPIETEANWFAAALLMPSEEFASMASAFNNDANALAGHFQVSVRAVEVRLSSVKR